MTSPRQTCSVPQISNRRFSEDDDGALGIWLPADCPFGNLRFGLTNIMLGVDEANRKTASAFERWQSLSGSMSLRAYSRHHLDLESAVFRLRRVADEIVSMHAVLSHLEQLGRYPDRIGINGVGTLLKHASTLNSSPYRGHQETLRTLTSIDNAHKHAFIGAKLPLAGGHEPVVAALALRRNGLSFGPKFFNISMRSLVEDFDGFYNDCLAWLAGWSQRHLHRAAA